MAATCTEYDCSSLFYGCQYCTTTTCQACLSTHLGGKHGCEYVFTGAIAVPHCKYHEPFNILVQKCFECEEGYKPSTDKKECIKILDDSCLEQVIDSEGCYKCELGYVLEGNCKSSSCEARYGAGTSHCSDDIPIACETTHHKKSDENICIITEIDGVENSDMVNKISNCSYH